MRAKFIIFIGCLFSLNTQAADEHSSEEHSSSIFHAFTLEGSTGKGRDDSINHWDLNGWVGGDDNKLWLKSEGAQVGHKTDDSELWALYSRNIATFWDAQAGLRYDSKPESTSYFVLGMNGLAPYYFETEAHFFVSNDGDVSFRLRQENDLLITQKWILQPSLEVNVFAQDVPNLEKGSGISDAKLGFQLRYEITRKISPYIELDYKKLYGDTASIAKTNGERQDDFIVSIGLRLMF